MIVLRHTGGRLVRTPYPYRRPVTRVADVAFWTVVALALVVLLLVLTHESATPPDLTVNHGTAGVLV